MLLLCPPGSVALGVQWLRVFVVFVVFVGCCRYCLCVLVFAAAVGCHASLRVRLNLGVQWLRVLWACALLFCFFLGMALVCVGWLVVFIVVLLLLFVANCVVDAVSRLLDHTTRAC